MKKVQLLALITLSIIAVSCRGKDDEVPASTLNHQGEKWNITSVTYTIVDMSLTNPQIETNATATNAGAFYFNNNSGSFDILLDNVRREDYFGYTESSGRVQIVSVTQSINIPNFSQNVIAISGNKSVNTMTLSGTITKQSLAGNFVMTADFTLTRAN